MSRGKALKAEAVVHVEGFQVDIIRQMPHLFGSQDKVKTLGQLLTEMEGEGGSLSS